MPWHPLAHAQGEGNLPLVEQNQGAFPFQASPGHNYDTWQWVYPAQTNQYTYFNAFYGAGNQLPNWNIYIPVYKTDAGANNQVNRPWYTSNFVNQQNAFQNQVAGSTFLQWGQQQAADFISKLGTSFAKVAGNSGGGRRR